MKTAALALIACLLGTALASAGFRGHDTYLTPKRVSDERTSVYIVKNKAGSGLKSRRARRSVYTCAFSLGR